MDCGWSNLKQDIVMFCQSRGFAFSLLWRGEGSFATPSTAARFPFYFNVNITEIASGVLWQILVVSSFSKLQVAWVWTTGKQNGWLQCHPFCVFKHFYLFCLLKKTTYKVLNSVVCEQTPGQGQISLLEYLGNSQETLCINSQTVTHFVRLLTTEAHSSTQMCSCFISWSTCLGTLDLDLMWP